MMNKLEVDLAVALRSVRSEFYLKEGASRKVPATYTALLLSIITNKIAYQLSRHDATLDMSEFIKLAGKGTSIVQKKDYNTGFYIKFNVHTNKVIGRKKFAGPYKDIPIVEQK
jgi:hypothetical protein